MTILDLLLCRLPPDRACTIGRLYARERTGELSARCWVLEDLVREVPGQPVASWKVPGKTAIPAGRYRIIITKSARFGRPLPLLLDVPGFSGIRIHPGNTDVDTEGCLLFGESARALALTAAPLPVNTNQRYSTTGIWISDSRVAVEREQALIETALLDGEVWITVVSSTTR